MKKPARPCSRPQCAPRNSEFRSQNRLKISGRNFHGAFAMDPLSPLPPSIQSLARPAQHNPFPKLSRTRSSAHFDLSGTNRQERLIAISIQVERRTKSEKFVPICGINPPVQREFPRRFPAFQAIYGFNHINFQKALLVPRFLLTLVSPPLYLADCSSKR